MRRKLSLWMLVSALAAVTPTLSPLADAAAQRTFVASFGSPANTVFNCSLAKPCRAFSDAIGVTLAKGEVIVLDSAGYGPVTIAQPVSIIAPAGIYAGITVFAGDGVTVAAGATDVVVLRGLTINGEGGANGVTVTNALVVHIENCVIANLVGIGINQAKGLLEVKDTIVRNNGNVGVYVVGPGKATLDHVRLEANNTGLAAEFGGEAVMQDSVVTGSTNIGVLANNALVTASSMVTISRSLISANQYGIYVDGPPSVTSFRAIVAIYESAVSNNVLGVHASSNGGSFNGRAYLKNSIVTSNDAGGIDVVNGGMIEIEGSYICRNGGLDLNVDATPSLVSTSKTNCVGDRLAPPGSVISPYAPF